MIGSYRDWLRQQYIDVSVAQGIGTAGTSVTPLIPAPKPKYAIYVQNVHLDVTVSSTPTASVQDNNGTPLVIANLPTTPTLGAHDFDYGDAGIQLTPGKELDLILSAAGNGFTVSVQAYARIPPGTVCQPSDL